MTTIEKALAKQKLAQQDKLANIENIKTKI